MMTVPAVLQMGGWGWRLREAPSRVSQGALAAHFQVSTGRYPGGFPNFMCCPQSLYFILLDATVSQTVTSP